MTSVRNKLNLSMKYWFMEAKIDFCICLGHGKGSKYHLKTVENIFSEKNTYYRTVFVKQICHLRRKLAAIFLKGLFFQKLFDDFMSHIIR